MSGYRRGYRIWSSKVKRLVILRARSTIFALQIINQVIKKFFKEKYFDKIERYDCFGQQYLDILFVPDAGLLVVGRVEPDEEHLGTSELVKGQS